MDYLHRFRKWKEFLRKEFPLTYPVRVYLCSPGERGLPVDQAGESRMFTDGNGKPLRFEILIRRGMPWNEAQSALWEEYAHCLRWHLPVRIGTATDNEHDSVFGILMNEISSRWNSL